MDKHTTDDVKAVETILQGSAYGKRVFIAENILKLISMGYLPRLQNLLLGARHEVRRITDPDRFQQKFEHPHKASAELNALSSPLGYVATKYTSDGVPHTTYYCTEWLTEEVVSMLTSSIAKQHAITLAAIRLDVGRILDAEDDNTDRSE